MVLSQKPPTLQRKGCKIIIFIFLKIANMEIKIFSPKSHKIKALVYGPSWSGKTSFWGTAKNVIFASSENWLLPLAGKNIPYVEIKSLQDLIDLKNFLEKWEHNFETLVIDSITEISDIIKNGIEKRNKRKMQLQDWWELASQIEGIIKDIKNIDINVIVIAQELNITDEEKIQRIVPSLNGKSSTKICYYMDVVGYIYVDKWWNRTMITSQNDKLLTKDRTWKIWNSNELDFENWRKLVNDLEVWEEEILYKTKTSEEIQKEEQEDLFVKFYEDLQKCKNMDCLKEKFLEITKNKTKISVTQYKELHSLKDYMKISITKQEKIESSKKIIEETKTKSSK